MKIQPLHDRIVVQPSEETVSPGGILIPDQAAERPIRGKVVAVGKGRIMEDGSVRPLDVKPGDCVLFPKYTGTEVKVDGEQYLVMREEDVLARISWATRNQVRQHEEEGQGRKRRQERLLSGEGRNPVPPYRPV